MKLNYNNKQASYLDRRSHEMIKLGLKHKQVKYNKYQIHL